MTEAELEKLEEIRQGVLEKLRAKYGADCVQKVDDLDPSITWRMANGEQIAGIEPWMYDLLNDFQDLLMSDPAIKVSVN